MISPVRLVDGARSAFRVAQRFSGAGLVLAALALWILPGASWAGDLALVKLTLSLAMGFSGLALWQMGSVSNRVEIELDTTTSEVKVMVNAMGRRMKVLHCRFNDLQRAELDGNSLRLWDSEGHFLAEVDMCSPEVKRRLMAAMENSGLLGNTS